MPAAAVIPAQVAYIKVVAVKALLVESVADARGAALGPDSRALVVCVGAGVCH